MIVLDNCQRLFPSIFEFDLRHGFAAVRQESALATRRSSDDGPADEPL